MSSNCHHGGQLTEAFKTLGRQLSNWGRWGWDDRLGTLNHITPERLVAAAREVRRGAIFDLSVPLASNGIQPGGFRNNPQHFMVATPADMADREDGLEVSDDCIIMPLQAATQWDGLGHVGYDGQMYNGVPSSSVSTKGSRELSIHQVAQKGIVGRGVLLDIAGAMGVDHLPGDFVIEAGRRGASGRSCDTGRYSHGQDRLDPPLHCRQIGCRLLEWQPGSRFPDHGVASPARSLGNCLRQLERRVSRPYFRKHGVAVPLHRHPRHGNDAWRNLRLRGAVHRLPGGRDLDLLPQRPADEGYRRSRHSRHTDSDQVTVRGNDWIKCVRSSRRRRGLASLPYRPEIDRDLFQYPAEHAAAGRPLDHRHTGVQADVEALSVRVGKRDGMLEPGLRHDLSI